MTNETIFCEEINIAELITSKVDRVQAVVLDSKIEKLPLSELTWPQFEALSVHLFEHTYKNDPTHEFGEAFRYGLPGQQQDGIDILISDLNTGKYIVAECKHKKEFTKKT